MIPAKEQKITFQQKVYEAPVDHSEDHLAEAAQKVVDLALAEGATCAILQSRSPTCGVKQVYDGSFSGVLIDGQGVLASALSAAGITLIDAEDVQ